MKKEEQLFNALLDCGYQPLRKIGEGGMADIYLALRPGPRGADKLLVLKTLRAALREEPELVSMFWDEARLASTFNHPNTPHTYEIGQVGGLPFIAMEYLEGKPLSRVRRELDSGDRRELALHLQIMCEVLRGLHYAHELKDLQGDPLEVVHRDVSPQNVLVSYDGAVKVLDFGIAKASVSSTKTSTGVLKGKFAYMSPEQARGAEIDRRADVFAVGIMLWEAAHGTRLWQGIGDWAIHKELCQGVVPSWSSEANDTAAPGLRQVCERALAPRVEDRFSSAKEMCQDLEECVHALGYSRAQLDLSSFMESRFAQDRSSNHSQLGEELRRVQSERSFVLAEQRASRGSSPPRHGSSSGEERQTERSTVPLTTSTMRERATGFGLLGLSAALSFGVLLAVFAYKSGRDSSEQNASDTAASTAKGGVSDRDATNETESPSRALLTHREKVRLSVITVPEQAEVFFDGAQAPSSGKVWFARDPEAETLVRVEASGYVPEQRYVALKDDTSLVFELKPTPEESRDDTKARGSTSTPVARSPANAEQGGSQKLQLDDTNPYSQ